MVVGLIAHDRGKAVEVADVVRATIGEELLLLVCQRFPPGRDLGGSPVWLGEVGDADDLVVLPVSIRVTVVIDVLEGVVEIRVDLVGILEDFLHHVRQRDFCAEYVLVFRVGVNCMNGSVSIDRAFMCRSGGQCTVGVADDLTDPVACALDGHQGAVDVGEGALERGEVGDGRRAHRGDGLTLGLKRVQMILTFFVGVAQALASLEQCLRDLVERTGLPLEDVCPCDRHVSFSLRGALGRAGFGDARHDLLDCLLVDLFGRLELLGRGLHVVGQGYE